MIHDVAIIGAGPGGMQAAIFAASEGLSTVIVERHKIGGQIGQTPKLENFVGQNGKGVTGPQLAKKMRCQAKGFGAKFVKGEAIDIATIGNIVGIELNGDRILRAKCVVLACGASWIPFDVPGIKELGSRLHYGPFHCMSVERGQTYIVVGGGNSAGQAIMELAQHAYKVHVIARSDVKCSHYLKDRITKSCNVQIHSDTNITQLDNNDTFFIAKLCNSDFIVAEQLFFCGGLKPNTEWLKNKIELDATGLIITKPDTNQTSMTGVLALGDCRKSNYRKSVANSIGDASNVITQIHRYLESLA